MFQRSTFYYVLIIFVFLVVLTIYVTIHPSDSFFLSLWFSPLSHQNVQQNKILLPASSSSSMSILRNLGTTSTEIDEPCNDPIWCTIPMPTISYYKFDPPNDLIRWRKAQIAASKGEHILLKEIMKVFPNHFDFLDGDISFRKLHFTMDFFVDERRDLSPLVASLAPSRKSRKNDDATGRRRRLAQPDPMIPVITAPKVVGGKLQYPWEVERRRVIPEPYDFRIADRAPVVGVGYTAFKRDSQTYFTGDRIGGAFIDRATFFNHWRKVKHRIDTPFIAICSLNENWGFLSTRFPNRTAGWGQCCQSTRDRLVYDFLEHDKTLMLVTNQHTNVSHPKLLILPRGIPITWGYTRMLVWDTMRNTLKKTKKDKLLFAASSKWGPRPQILRCISEQMTQIDFDGHVKNPPPPRLDRREYYEKLSTAYFGLGLPGLGYDCFRNWELMTLGTIVVLEKAVGFDRTMWRLPALLLEDFAEITPELLRTAYVEAVYRAKEFEYHRLTMSFWFSVIANVSSSKSTQPLLDLFPVEAEDPNFTRPREPYECGKTNTCGKGTKRTPKRSC